MKTLLRAALLPALLQLAKKETPSLSAGGGAYAGVDLSDGSAFLGMQGRLNPEEAPVQITLSVEGSPRSSADRWQGNADVLLPFSDVRAPLTPYAGAGLCVVGTSDEGGTRLGVNLIGGARFRLGPVKAFAQLRLTLADGLHVSLTGGATSTPD